MNVLTTNTLAVPDSSFPFGSELEGFAGLMDPPSPEDYALGGLKLASLQGEDGYPPNFCPPFPFEPDHLCGLDADWMCQSTHLPTPQEQETDVGSLLPFPAVAYADPTTLDSLPTPESSYPPTPSSSCDYQDYDVLNVLSLLSSSTDSQLDQSAEVLPQFDVQSPLSSPSSYNPASVTYSASPATYDFSSTSYDPTPMGAFLPSPLPPSSQEFSPDTAYPYTIHVDYSPPASPLSEIAKSEGIRDLLVKSEEDTPCLGSDHSCKRKAMSTVTSESMKGKRRKLSKTAKKERKKEQNKQAALRYRQRKRGEVEVIDDKREQLEAINSGLKTQVNALTAEINYLTKLWKEIEDAKGRRFSAQSRLE